MSREVHVNFEVRSSEIMKLTLDQMGVGYTEHGDTITAKNSSGYRDISINAAAGRITYDNSDESHVNKIKQNYMVNFFRDTAIKEGKQLQEKKLANGTVELYLS